MFVKEKLNEKCNCNHAGGFFSGSVFAESELIAGWENWSKNHVGEATRTSGVQASHTSSNWSVNTAGASTDGAFGNYYAEPVADRTNDNLDDGLWLPNGTQGQLIFTLTDTSGTARSLIAFHFNSGSLRKKSSRHWKLEVLSEDLTAGVVATGMVPEPVTGGTLEWCKFDVDLTSLGGNVLKANGTVVFRLSFSGGTGGSSGHHQMLDNVGISAEFIQEPTTLGLVL